MSGRMEPIRRSLRSKRLSKEVSHEVFWVGKLFVVLDFLNENVKGAKVTFSVVLET